MEIEKFFFVTFLQPIDAGIGRSVRIRIGHALDDWLMEASNLEKWKTKISASERRIVTTRFIGSAMIDVMANENNSMRIRAFEKNGCLLTWLPNAIHDEKICPQGLEKGTFRIPQEIGVEVEVTYEIPVGVDPEEAGILEEQVIIDEGEDDGNMFLEN